MKGPRDCPIYRCKASKTAKLTAWLSCEAREFAAALNRAGPAVIMGDAVNRDAKLVDASLWGLSTYFHVLVWGSFETQ